ncbi:MAG: hypothetical protein HYY48_02670 [Gammaproteobacteria bacterium]|nr:hypothetical protein [Gammaproteobacteria bacterium]
MNLKRKGAETEIAQLRELLSRAMQHPGVAELMNVYNSWKKYDDATRGYDLLKAARQTFSLSTSSGPLLRWSD